MDGSKEEYRLSYVPLHDDAESSARARARPLSSAEQVFLQSQVRSCFWGASWTWEIISCLSTIAFFIAIIVVLWYYDGRPMPDWPYGITLNAMISVFSTIMKASMAFIVAESLAQLKWSWFRGGNKLSDLAMLDAGSRGAMGSLLVLIRTVPRHLVTYGCLVLVLATATDPFVQQVMAIKERQIHAPGNSTIQRCNTSTYTDYAEGEGPGMNEVPLGTLGAIYSGLFQTQTPNSRSIMMNCPTGNCTFDTYQSLGFCSRCANITDSLKLKKYGSASLPTYNYTLPNDFVFSTSTYNTQLMNSTANLPLIQIDTTGSVPILNYTAISSPGYGDPPQVSATECALFFCVDTYEANVEQGTFSENRTAFYTSSNASMSDVLSTFTLTPDVCYKNGTRLEKPEENDEDCSYNVNGFSKLAISNSLSSLLEGTGSRPIINRPYWSPKSLRALYGTYGNFTEINSVFQSLATSLTINARSKVCQENVDGISWTDQSFVQVRWKWMILPGALVLFSVVFLIITIFHTRDQYIWKSSPLALLFSQLLIDDPLPLKSNPTLRDMESRSRNMEVLLETTPEGVRLKTIPRS